jgi:phosphopantothenoylcysteine decarboxylase/phosphopantothenate--cysteine ligase
MARCLENKSVLLGLSGGIACYKAADFVRALRRAGATVRVVMTASAEEFITPMTMQTLSGNPVGRTTFDLTRESQIGHIELADGADAVVVAPATANIIGKMANGIADDLLTTVLLATQAPLLVAPAMNVHMFENPMVRSNIEKLRDHGVTIIEPGEGSLACGYEGKGRLADTEILVAETARALSAHDLDGEHVLVSAGPNREPIDPVRFISNRSTGKMGFALAAAAWRRGARVTLVAGPTSLPTPHGVERIDVGTAEEMHDAIVDAYAHASIVFMAAAVADYRVVNPATEKIKKGPGGMMLELDRTVDVLAELAAQREHQLLVGFAAETEHVLANAQRKLRDKGIDLIVANDVSGSDTGFGVDTNAVTIFSRKGDREIVPLMSKDDVADRILDATISFKSRLDGDDLL